jgi:integrase
VRRKIEERLALGDLGVLASDKPERMSFEVYSEKWFREYATVHLKPASVANTGSLRLFVTPVFGKTELARLRREAVKTSLADLSEKNLARNTVRLALCAFRVVLSHAVEDGLVDSNPCARLGKFTKTEKPEREACAMTRDERDRFLASASVSTPDYDSLFLVALCCGLRQRELIALKWGDIQFGADKHDRNRYIIVSRNYSRGRFTTTKGNRARRVDMSKRVRQSLMRLRDERLLSAMQVGKASIADDLVFPARSEEKKDESEPQKPSGRRLDPQKPLNPSNLVHYHCSLSLSPCA